MKINGEPLIYRDVFAFCPICRAPIQRMLDPKSTIEDGMRAHVRRIHKGAKVEP